MDTGYTVAFINSITGKIYDWMYVNSFTSTVLKTIENALMEKAAESNECKAVRAEVYANNGRSLTRIIHGFTVINGPEIRMNVIVGGQIIRTMTIAE